MSFKPECRKFQPNIFNKIKCSNCFRQKEEHSAKALESNRASRKVSKCGYLFVAPDWDFSIPLNRTKRWQRRWFVLYDDGELTYSVDDLPATIPQGIIDMNRVLEVSEAEDVTGNQFALAITSPDRATFVKGTCREESRWWRDVLSVFPRSHKHGRHKRNATFPGIKASSCLQHGRTSPSPPHSGSSYISSSPQRFSSFTDSFTVSRPSSAPILGVGGPDDILSLKPPKSIPNTKGEEVQKQSSSVDSSQQSSIHGSCSSSSSLVPTIHLSEDHTDSSYSNQYAQDYCDNPPTSESPPTQDKVLGHKPRTRRTSKREARGLFNPRRELSQKRLMLSTPSLEESKRDVKLKDIAESFARPNRLYSSMSSFLNYESLSDSQRLRVTNDSTSASCHSTPNGMGIQRVDIPTENVLYTKKGWLLKQGLSEVWSKHWFVLEGSGLKYYRDPSSEDNGILDGILDLGNVKEIKEKDVGRNYGFIVKLWDDKRLVFSALTAGIRSNWIQAMKTAATQKEASLSRNGIAHLNDDISLSNVIGSDKKKRIDCNRELYTRSDRRSSRDIAEQEDRPDVSVYSPFHSHHSFLTSDKDEDEDYKTASESSFLMSEQPCAIDSSCRQDLINDVTHRRRNLISDIISASSSKKNEISNKGSSYAELNKHSGFNSRSATSRSSLNLRSSKSSPQPSGRRFSRDELTAVIPPQTSSPAVISSNLSSSTSTINSCSSFLSETESIYLSRLKSKHFTPEKDLSSRGGNASIKDDGLIVELLEAEVDSLKSKLEQTQMLDSNKTKVIEREEEFSKSSISMNRIENLRKQLSEERRESEKQLLAEQTKVKELKSSQAKHAEITRKLTRSLQESEVKISSLNKELNKSSDIQDKLREQEELNSNLRMENVKLSQQVLETKEQVRSLQESLKSEKSESYKWKDLVKELRSLLDGRNQDMEAKREELTSLREKLKDTQSELNTTADRLRRGIEENENLCGRLRELERGSSALQERQTSCTDKVSSATSSISISNGRDRFSSCKRNLPRMDSLSDLTNCDLTFDPEELDKDGLVEEYCDLRNRFEKAIVEIRALKKELRVAESLQDESDFTLQRVKTELKAQEEDFKGQMQLMETRLQDLTNKLTNSDKHLRALLKTKSNRNESRERRRTLSLKGKESFTFSKDLEVKISELESKLNSLLTSPSSNVECSSVVSSAAPCCPLKETRRSKSFEESSKKCFRNRRKSLDSQAIPSEDALTAVIRLNAIEDKVLSLSGRSMKKASSSLSLDSSNSTSRGATPRTKSPIISPANSKKNLWSSTRSKSTLSLNERSSSSSKVKRSESESRILKEKLTTLENAFAYLQTKLSEGLSCSKAFACLCSCDNSNKPLSSRLEEILSTCLQIAQYRDVPVHRNPKNNTQLLASKIQIMLRDKIHQLGQRRQDLRASEKWTRNEQLKNLAEKLAFEVVIFNQLIPNSCSLLSLESSQRFQELIEAHRKISFLEKKLTDPHFDMSPLTPIEFYTNLLAERLAVGADVFSGLISSKSHSSIAHQNHHPSVLLQNNSSAQSHSPKTYSAVLPSASPLLDGTCKDLLNKLLDRERHLAELMMQYKTQKLTDLARVMARDTINGTLPEHDETVLVEEIHLREAWSTAQEILNEEIAALETSNSVSRLSSLLSRSEIEVSSACQNNSDALERLQVSADDSLRQEMEESAFILSRKYEEALKDYREGNEDAIALPNVVISDVLAEFASLIAQKALVDGQLAVATFEESSDIKSGAVKPNIEKSEVDILDTAKDVVASESHLLMFLGSGNNSSVQSSLDAAMTQAEMIFLFNHTASQLCRDYFTSVVAPLSSSSSSKDEISSSCAIGASSLKKLPSPKPQKRSTAVDSPSRKNRRTSDITGMVLDTSGGCLQCDELRHDVARLRRVVDSKKAKKTVEVECNRCEEYKCALKYLEEEHRTAMETLEGQHQTEMDRLRDQVKYDPPTRDSDDELTELKRRLCLLEEGYEAQIAALKKQYSEALGSQSDVCEENIRQRYQLEIEHLRDLCEKGLTAMETSHRRVVNELEVTHKREMDQLKSEKEEALAEETAATLAALDAMRKAHEAEVQKEVAKFKEEWLRRAGDDGQSPSNSLREEQRELKEVRTEILALSEKYSSKCLEMAAKEQKLESLQRLLAENKTQNRSLEERNRLLKQRLNAHLSHMHNVSKRASIDIGCDQEVDINLQDDQMETLPNLSETKEGENGKETEISVQDG